MKQRYSVEGLLEDMFDSSGTKPPFRIMDEIKQDWLSHGWRWRIVAVVIAYILNANNR